jgi:hypothetical protein
MNLFYRSQWTSALRSGRYEQGVEHLRPTEGTFCAFGVLCDVIDRSWWYRGSDNDGGWLYQGDEGLAELRRLKELEPDVHATVIRMNDSGMSFADIADYLDYYQRS